MLPIFIALVFVLIVLIFVRAELSYRRKARLHERQYQRVLESLEVEDD